jgi:hypothetical protein
MGARRSRAEWEEVVRAFATAGEPLETFCAKRRIRPETLKWWRWRLGAAAEVRSSGARSSGLMTVRRAAKDVRLVPVDVIVPAVTSARASTIEISLSDVEVRVEVGTDPVYVGALVGALRSRC